MGGGVMPELRNDRRDLERLQHLVFMSYGMAFPNQEYPGDTEALATMVATVQCMREALAGIGVVLRSTRIGFEDRSDMEEP